MVSTLRESKAKLSELVERASRGEDVLITVRGTVTKGRGKPKLTIERILAEQRADRV